MAGIKKPRLVVCCRANEERMECRGCSEAVPHEPHDTAGVRCTMWGVCVNSEGLLRRVRCTTVKESPDAT